MQQSHSTDKRGKKEDRCEMIFMKHVLIMCCTCMSACASTEYTQMIGYVFEKKMLMLKV